MKYAYHSRRSMSSSGAFYDTRDLHGIDGHGVIDAEAGPGC